mgnify:CR=1 FL=1
MSYSADQYGAPRYGGFFAGFASGAASGFKFGQGIQDARANRELKKAQTEGVGLANEASRRQLDAAGRTAADARNGLGAGQQVSGGTAPIFTSATSRTRIGVALRVATTT